MKFRFLTIPFATDYEINAKLVCRRKSTGYTLKLLKRTDGSRYYALFDDGGRRRNFIPKSLWRLTVDATKPNTFEPIPSLNGKYEIDTRGNVRNARTKRRLKVSRSNMVTLYIDANHIVCRSIPDLLWEVHGKPKKGFRPRPCSAENVQGKWFFKSSQACARFLLGKTKYTLQSLQCYLWRRKPIIDGWTIRYFDEDIFVNDTSFRKSLNREAHYLRRTDAKLAKKNSGCLLLGICL